jgi:hypothetical protein
MHERGYIPQRTRRITDFAAEVPRRFGGGASWRR